MTVKNVAFDIGNVLLKWEPTNIITHFFPNESIPEPLAQQIFKSPIWIDLNLGKITELEAVKLYNEQLNIPIEQLIELMLQTKYSSNPNKRLP